jgi:chromosome segregation ATPase
VGLIAKTIERLWKWKSAHRVQLEELEDRNAMLADRCEILEVQAKEQESRIDSLTFRLSQYEGLESRVDERFAQLQGELDRLQQTEKSRETHQDRLLHSVEEAGKVLEVLQTQYQSRLSALEAVKDQSFDVHQRLYPEKNLHGDELVTLRGHLEKLLYQVVRFRKIS